MWKQRILTCMVALAAITAGCKPPASLAPLASEPATKVVESGAQRQTLGDPRILSGVLEFPAGRQTQATATDVVNAATLSLIDTATNLTVVGGVMSNGGTGRETFSLAIPLTFQPTLGQVFMLEAVKGLNSNTPGNEAVRLRTFVQWTASGWTSITGSSTIALTAMTTAVALISNIDPSNVPPAQTIGDVTYNLGASTFSGSIPAHTATEVANLTRSVNDFIAGNVDPVANTSRLTPQVTGLTVNRGAVGDVVAVYGDGFSPITGAATVSFNGANVGTYVVRSRTAMYVVVPTGATTGNVTVTTVNGTSNGLPFTVSTPGATTISPVVTGLSRSVVRRGDTLTLTGYNFDANYALNTVTLNGTINLPVVNGSSAFLTVSIPNTAVSGAIKVTNVNGPSGAWYLGVLTSGTQSVVETFTNAATKDTSVTTLDWTNTGTLGYPALVNWGQQGAEFGATTAGATVDTMVNTFPKGGGVGIRQSVNGTSYVTTSDSYPNTLPSNGGGLATNGDVLLGIESNALYSIKIQSIRDTNQEYSAQLLGYPFVNVSNSSYLGMAGLQGSNVFYYLQGYGQTSITSLKRLRVDDYGYTRMTDIALPITINRYSTYSYGFRIGSDGNYILIWAGQGTGYSTSSSYFYRFAINGDTATLVEVKTCSPSYFPQDTSNYYYLTADDQYFHMTGFDGTYPRTQAQYLGTGGVYTSGFSLPYNRTSYYYYNYLCYDAKNDCYWITNPGQVGNYVQRLTRSGSYATTQGNNSVTSPAINLPAGQVWDQLSYGGEIAPQGTIKLEVLNAGNNNVLYTAPASTYGTFSRTLDIRSALAGYTGAIKLRAWLDTSNSNNTPYMTSWRVTSAWANPPLAQSNAYDTRVTSGAVSYLSYTLDQPSGAPAVTIMFSDSPDGNTWSAWTPNLTTLSKRYVRWQITPSVASSYSGILANRVQIDYQY